MLTIIICDDDGGDDEDHDGGDDGGDGCGDGGDGVVVVAVVVVSDGDCDGRCRARSVSLPKRETIMKGSNPCVQHVCVQIYLRTRVQT